MKYTRLTSLFFVFIILLLYLFFTSCTARKRQARTENTFYSRISSEPNTLNPILTTDAYSSAVQGFIFNGLFTTNESLTIIPELARDYTISEDNRRYIVQLRDDVRWHDGEPFTSEDVKFTIATYLSPSTNTVYRSNFMIDNKPIKMTILSPHSIQFDLPKPFAPFLSRLTTSILPKHSFESVDINKNPHNRHPLGTGPFKFSDWKSGQYIRLVRNKDYFEGTPHIEQIIIRFIPNDLTAIVSLENEEIDEATIKPKDLKSVADNTYLKTHTYQQMSYIYIGFNLKKPPFDSLFVRQAIAHAINKQRLVSQVLLNQGRVADLPNHPLSWAYPDEASVSIYDYNPDKSRDLLEQAGYQFNESSTFYEKNGHPLAFTVQLTKGNTVRENSAKIIQQYLKQVGIKMSIRVLEFQTLVATLKKTTDVKDFDAVLLGWSLGLDPDAYSIWHSSQFPSGFNFVGYKNKEVDRLLIQARQETNLAKRKALYQPIYGHITADIPYVFLFYENTLHTVNTRLKGLAEPSPAGIFLHLEALAIEP